MDEVKVQLGLEKSRLRVSQEPFLESMLAAAISYCWQKQKKKQNKWSIVIDKTGCRK